MNATATFEDFIYDLKIPNPYTLLKKGIDEYTKTSNGDSSNYSLFFKVHPSQIIDYKNNNNIINNLKAKINSLSVSPRWVAENVDEPNYVCREKTFEIVQYLYNDYQYYPERISPSIEGGIYIHYINYLNHKSLSVEVSNHLEIAALVNKHKNIIKSVDIFNFDFSEIIQIYVS